MDEKTLAGLEEDVDGVRVNVLRSLEKVCSLPLDDKNQVNRVVNALDGIKHMVSGLHCMYILMDALKNQAVEDEVESEK